MLAALRALRLRLTELIVNRKVVIVNLNVSVPWCSFAVLQCEAHILDIWLYNNDLFFGINDFA